MATCLRNSHATHGSHAAPRMLATTLLVRTLNGVSQSTSGCSVRVLYACCLQDACRCMLCIPLSLSSLHKTHLHKPSVLLHFCRGIIYLPHRRSPKMLLNVSWPCTSLQVLTWHALLLTDTSQCRHQSARGWWCWGSGPPRCPPCPPGTSARRKNRGDRHSYYVDKAIKSGMGCPKVLYEPRTGLKLSLHPVQTCPWLKMGQALPSTWVQPSPRTHREVPLNIVAQQAALGVLQELEHGLGARAVHVHLSQQRIGHAQASGECML